jgi:hypothetical protein
MKIRIIDVPPGEAPEEVRKAWVGLELPLAAGAQGRRKAATFGVVSGPTSLWASMVRLILGRFRAIQGYSVDASTAIQKLEESAPEAANWWKKNTPHLLKHGRRLVFHREVCEELED